MTIEKRSLAALARTSDWNVHVRKEPDGSIIVDQDVIRDALLQAILNELRALNRTLSCYRLPRMSDDINRIDRRLAKHMPFKSKAETKRGGR
jgi:formiminotetrahydrofolate cyclodeaminase